MKVLDHSKQHSSYYLLNLEGSYIDQSNLETIKRFCQNAKITYCQGKLSEFNQENPCWMNFLNNILIRTMSSKSSKKRKEKKNKTYNDVHLMESGLSSFSEYKMLENKDENNHLGLKLTHRKHSYTQKMPKKKD